MPAPTASATLAAVSMTPSTGGAVPSTTPSDVHGEPRHEAEDDRAARQRAQQGVPHALPAFARGHEYESARCLLHRVVRPVRGLRDINRCIVTSRACLALDNQRVNLFHASPA